VRGQSSLAILSVAQVKSADGEVIYSDESLARQALKLKQRKLNRLISSSSCLSRKSSNGQTSQPQIRDFFSTSSQSVITTRWSAKRDHLQGKRGRPRYTDVDPHFLGMSNDAPRRQRSNPFAALIVSTRQASPKMTYSTSGDSSTRAPS
jgi:hypothetical protein